MLINEVESTVGLSKKSIRYYEQVGLFTPQRTNNNAYRNYTEKDLIILKKIKFLRSLDVSIHELQKLTNKELSLKECMQNRIEKLANYEKNYQKIKLMCKEISNTNVEYDNLNIDKYFKDLNILSKEGFIMKDLNKDHSKKISGAITSSLILIALFLFFAILITYFQVTETEKMPMALYIFFMGFFIIPTISVIINLIARIKEIKGGEEDEASKY